MWKTVILLLLSIVLVPLLTWRLDIIPSDLQWDIIRQTYVLCLGMALLCFLVSNLSRNYSQVDKLWSIMPVVYAWMIYGQAPDGRILLMAILISIWGLRLTFNFARRGGYSWRFWTGTEDYRWEILRQKRAFQPYWKWMLFNLFFISWYQMTLIWLITLPLVKATTGPELSLVDLVLALLGISFVIVETIADQQQWNFQENKKRTMTLDERRPADQPQFLNSGLWAYVRHPNYMSEQGFWWTVYAFSIVATGTLINWSIAGAFLLLLLFRGSSDFSESISASKYPEYHRYQQQVPRFLPRWRKGYRPDEEVHERSDV